MIKEHNLIAKNCTYSQRQISKEEDSCDSDAKKTNATDIDLTHRQSFLSKTKQKYTRKYGCVP